MKKIMIGMLLAAFVAVNAYAMTQDEARRAHRDEVKKIKATMKEEKKAGPPSKMSAFWKKEGERSGMNQWAPSKAGGFFKSMNPAPYFKDQQDKFNARKSGGVK